MTDSRFLFPARTPRLFRACANSAFILFAALLLCVGATVRAQPAPSDPFAEHLYPPDFVLQRQQLIALTQEQRRFIEGAVQKTQTRVQEAEKRKQQETQKLAALVDHERVNEAAALAQSDRIASADQEIGRAQLGLLISIKNKLTPEQLAKLKALKTKLLSLQAKAERIQSGFQRWQDQGRDPSPLAQIMQQVEPLMRDGKDEEAEALLDRALHLIDGAKDK
jgi:Spy/CpxP family protein refolding chaperone